MEIKSNPLTTELAFLDAQQSQQLIDLAHEKIRDYRGHLPHYCSITPLRYKECYGGLDVAHHLVTLWRNTRLTEHKVVLLEELAKDITAPVRIPGRRDFFGKAVRPDVYRTTEYRVRKVDRGYHFCMNSLDNNGLFIMRSFDSLSDARQMMRQQQGRWLYQGKTFVELRLPLFTPNLSALEYITRAACILADNHPADVRPLIYDLYRALILQSVEVKTADQLVGLENLLNFIRWTMFVPSTSPAASYYGLKPQSVMLAGVPGVGKTTVAKVLAAENQQSLFVPVEATLLVNSLSERKEEVQSSLFPTLRRLQKRTGIATVLYCDDLESAMLDPTIQVTTPEYLAGTSTLLNKLQGIAGSNGLLAGATNNPSLVDPRFLEFGRVGYVLHVPLPHLQAREKTLDLYTKSRLIRGTSLRRLAEATEGFTNRALEELCNQAGLQALRRAATSIRKSREPLESAAKRVTLDIAHDFPITGEDLQQGYQLLTQHVRINEIQRLDREIARFCREYTPAGFKRH